VRWIARLLILLALVGAAAFGAWTWLGHWSRTPMHAVAQSLEVEIRPGASIRMVARALHDAGAPIDEDLFVLMTRLERAGGVPKAGFYRVGPDDSPLAVFDRMVRGESIQSEIRFIEGWTFRQYRKALEDHPDVRREGTGLADPDVLRAVGASQTHPEGLFFPDTYLFPKGTTDIAILKRAHAAMQKHLDAAWSLRSADSPLRSAYELAVLASIVEKETGRPEDRGMVAAVFANRLRKGMRLQADPTVIYGLGNAFDGNLRKRDLVADTPYNTYTRAGLPPTPIAMPGLASLRAAARPETSDALYFVARGDGSSAFSRTLDEHNNAVNRFQRGGG